MRQKALNNYLEIGVSNGHVFFRIKSSFKVAVDPCFAFGKRRIFGKILLNPFNLFNRYFQMTSDDFFAKKAKTTFAEQKPEIIFIDGMHEYAYALRDIEHSLSLMPEHGVIVVHDCNPLTKLASSPFEIYENSDGKGFWNGDVWKAILHLRNARTDLNIFVLDCDHGLGIITKGKPENVVTLAGDDIDSLTYEDFEQNRKEWLNLKNPEHFYTFFGLTGN